MPDTQDSVKAMETQTDFCQTWPLQGSLLSFPVFLSKDGLLMKFFAVRKASYGYLKFNS